MIFYKKYLLLFLLISCHLAVSKRSYAQEHPPFPITVYVNLAQGLNFGGFYQGITGGSVIIYPNGTRSVTGDVVEINTYSFSPALFEVEANPGTVVSILNGPDVVLSGSNSGNMTLHIGSSDPASPLITTVAPPAKTLISVGGTLTVNVPIANPPGSYSGIFTLIFVQQ